MWNLLQWTSKYQSQIIVQLLPLLKWKVILIIRSKCGLSYSDWDLDCEINETKQSDTEKHERKLNSMKNLAVAITRSTQRWHISSYAYTLQLKIRRLSTSKLVKKLRGVITHTERHIHICTRCLYSQPMYWIAVYSSTQHINHQQ